MARSKIKHFKGFSIVDGDIQVTLNMSRFERQFQRAQYQLDGAVMNSMVPFMPHQNGTFIQNTRAASAAIQGSGEVYAAYGIQGGLIKKEAPLDSSNVMIVCPSCEKPTKIKHAVVDGKKVRVARKSGEVIDK